MRRVGTLTILVYSRKPALDSTFEIILKRTWVIGWVIIAYIAETRMTCTDNTVNSYIIVTITRILLLIRILTEVAIN